MEIRTKFNIGDKVVYERILEGDDKPTKFCAVYQCYMEGEYEVEGVSYKYCGTDLEIFCIISTGSDKYKQRYCIPEEYLKLATQVISKDTKTNISISVEEVYGQAVVIPDGYRFKCFAKPKRGDIMISADRVNINADFKVDCAPWDYQTPRIILEKI